MEEKLKLIIPPASQTSESLAILWDKFKGEVSVKHYEIYLNGALHGICQSTDYTLSGLESDTEYEVKVRAVLEEGESSIESRILKLMTKPRYAIFNITDFGAVGDGQTINTKAIQAAIDACTVDGKVYIPKGTFVSGAIHLKSHMTLYLEEGSVLKGSDNLLDFEVAQYRFEGLETTCYASLVNAGILDKKRRKNITIEGTGTIDANGVLLRKLQLAENKGKPGRAVCLNRVDNVYLKDVTIRQSPAWCVHLIYCNGVSLNQVKIHSKYDEKGKEYDNIVNGDGFDPDSCKDVYVFHSLIASGDDCIAIKSGRDAEGRLVNIPTERVRITNCQFKSGFGVAIGSEMAAGVRDVLVQDCTFEDVFSIGSLKAPRGRGGIIENIVYEDSTYFNRHPKYTDCKWFRGAIYIDQYYGEDAFDVNDKKEVSDRTPYIRNVIFRNITLDTCGGHSIYIAGLPESPIENVCLENISAIGMKEMVLHNISSLSLKNVCVKVHPETVNQQENK